MSTEEEQKSEWTITIRLIKSFEFRNVKNMVLHVDPKIKVSDLKLKINETIQTSPAFRTMRTHKFETLQIYFHPHSFKPNALVIDTAITKDPKTDILVDDLSLESQNVENETELSYFNQLEYETFLKNPHTEW